ncbi:PAS domain S-box protein [Exilibacterium tricleocarpae]|nr:PAS domain S-box protein [Exilibacterium tricleocarpae]
MNPTLLEAFPFEIVVIDKQFERVCYANANIGRNLGYSLEQFQKMTPDELLGKQQASSLYRQLEPMLRHSPPETPSREVDYLRKDGSHYPVKAYFKHCTYDGDDCIMFTSLDSSDRRSHIERRAIEHLPAGAVVTTPDTLYMNKAATAITGYNRKEFDSIDQWYALFPKNIVTGFKHKSKSWDCIDRSTPIIVPITTKTGAPRLLELSHHGIDESMSIWMFQDVTERETLLNKLRWSEAKASAVLNTVPDGIVNIDLRGEITSFNQAAEKIFGYRSEEVLGGDITRLLPDAHRHEDIARYLRTGHPKLSGNTIEAEGRRKNGDAFPVQLTVIEVAVGNQIILTGIIKDLTEQKEMERLTRQHNEEVRQYREDMVHISRIMTLSEIATEIAHEINQPLASISTYAQACLQLMENTTTAQPAELKNALQQISKQSRRAGGVISQLRVQVKQREIDPIPIDINKLIDYTLTLLADDLKDQNIILQTVLQPHLPEINGITVQLQQILFNLILNGIDAINAKGDGQRLIKIKTGLTEDNWVRVSVSDTGVGIAKADRDKIFTSYYSTKESGMGIGLSICQSVINGHGGKLDFNHRKRKGAEFYFTLPAYKILKGADHGDD